MHIFSNLATSIDGKIACAGREYFPIGTPHDRKFMQTLRKRADIVLMGASSLRTYRRPCPVFAWPASRQPYNAVVSRNLSGVSPRWSFFTSPLLEGKRLLFVSQKPMQARVFEKSSEIVVLGKQNTARALVRELNRRGFERLLVEGGGEIMWEFVSQGLIDEFFVTLTPKLIGGTEAPTLVDGKGFAPAKVPILRLKSSKRVGDELYLCYTR